MFNSIAEKDDLLLRNAQLSQEFESYKRRQISEHNDLQEDIKSKDRAIKRLEETLTDLKKQITEQQEKVGVMRCNEISEETRSYFWWYSCTSVLYYVLSGHVILPV